MTLSRVVRGDFAEAELRYRQALALFEELGDRAGMANGHLQLGILAQVCGDHAEAERRYLRALSLNEELDNHSSMAAIHARLGDLAELRQRLPEAIIWHLHAFLIRARVGIPDGAHDARCLNRYRTAVGAAAFSRIAIEGLGDLGREVAEMFDELKPAKRPVTTCCPRRRLRFR